jgi:hypothetical protein
MCVCSVCLWKFMNKITGYTGRKEDGILEWESLCYTLLEGAQGWISSDKPPYRLGLDSSTTNTTSSRESRGGGESNSQSLSAITRRKSERWKEGPILITRWFPRMKCRKHQGYCISYTWRGTVIYFKLYKYCCWIHTSSDSNSRYHSHRHLTKK